MSHFTQSGMPKGRPFPENELVWLDCPNCEYHVRVHQSTKEVNMRQHKEKGCPLVTTGETPEVKDRSPLELQAPLCPEPCSDCTCLPSNWYKVFPLAPATSPEPISRAPSPKVEPTPPHSWEPLRKALRTFDTGASRDTDEGKMDYEGFLSPLVLERFAEYMHHHRYQSDGTLRDSDNWQRGIPMDEYMKSGFRHFVDVWKLHRGYQCDVEMGDALCATLFNLMGYLHELLGGDEGQYR